MNIVILTGAGVSADSGMETFRTAGGLWSKYDLSEVATPEGFAANPALVHEFYNLRRASLSEVSPNPAHLALVDLEQACAKHGHGFLLITQNVDDLHHRAGSQQLLAMHGHLDEIQCTHCGHTTRWSTPCSELIPCPHCRQPGGLRPNVVWFGEIPRGQRAIETAMGEATLFAAIGTSGAVYPAAGLVALARSRNIQTLEFNMEPADNAALFDDARYGSAADTVPAWVDDLITSPTFTGS